jgi:hypothetical protein
MDFVHDGERVDRFYEIEGAPASGALDLSPYIVNEVMVMIGMSLPASCGCIACCR